MKTEQLIQFAGYGYVGLLVGSVWWYGTRRSGIARSALAFLIFLPAALCFYAGLSMFGAVSGSHHTPDAVSAVGGLVSIITFGIWGLGALIAFFGIRVLIRPLKPKHEDKQA